MKKNALILFALICMLSGCAKKVYIAPVPCETDCKPCFVGLSEKCPETEVMTERQIYQVEDIEKEKVDYSYIAENKIRRCKNVCRLKKVEK